MELVYLQQIKYSGKPMLIIFIICMFGFLIGNGTEVLKDDFNREGKLYGSKTSDGKYVWSVFTVKVQQEFLTAEGRLNFNAAGGVMCINHEDMKCQDFDLAFDFTYLSQHYARGLSVNYRIQGKHPNARLSDGGYTGGYVMHIERPSWAILRVSLFKESLSQTKAETKLAETIVEIGTRWNVTTKIRLHVEGNRHQIFVNDEQEPTIDAMDKEYTTEGWWNIADGALTKRAIDNLIFSNLDLSDKSSSNETNNNSSNEKNEK
ncbi:MAG: hypothetical protein A2096_16970 [Spirochaetes bacterium GWF1_41_5]|nr:MAG: hypothetical protein A2096_16970 [Spirochaetes bacterium GWF1_41_5]